MNDRLGLTGMRFEHMHNRFFSSHTGAYSILTAREFADSQLTLTDDEFQLANYFFGGRIHSGPVRLDPDGSLKEFRLYPTGKQIGLNLIYPKPEREELRLYLSERRGFKPRPGDIWFLFERDAKLFLGSMPANEWNHHFGTITNTHA